MRLSVVETLESEGRAVFLPVIHAGGRRWSVRYVVATSRGVPVPEPAVVVFCQDVAQAGRNLQLVTAFNVLGRQPRWSLPTLSARPSRL